MKLCKQCNEKISSGIMINGTWKKTGRRTYCYKCSPYGEKKKRGKSRNILIENIINAKCSRCKKLKTVDNFFVKKSGYIFPYCKDCWNIITIENQKKSRKKLRDYLGGKCLMCGYNKCDDALEFHHKDPNKKEFGLGGNYKSFKKVKKEIEKCILLCSNCHKEIHAKLRSSTSSS